MAVPKIGSTRVPFIGDENADIMLVGEAPGKDEVREGEPFVGKSGNLLTRYIERHNVRRDEVYLANLCKYRPKGNKFYHLLNSTELEIGLAELTEAIEEVDPNVIIALGNWPLYYLTGQTGSTGKKGTGVTNWRGSVLPCSLTPGKKVFVTYHPAFIARPTGFKWNPVFHHDLGRAIEQASFPEIRYPNYDVYIDPPKDVLHELAEEMGSADFLSVDIENFPGGKLSCIGFADSADRALVLTFQRQIDNWPVAEYLLRSEAGKIFQFGKYDIDFLNWFYDWPTHNYSWDTYIASATIMPEFPRGLDFLASVYTDFPYYKEERKTWKQTQNLNDLWQYNAKDVIATYTIAMKQMDEIEQLFGADTPPLVEAA